MAAGSGPRRGAGASRHCCWSRGAPRLPKGWRSSSAPSRLRPDDAGLWYALGWVLRVRGARDSTRPALTESSLDPRALYEQAAEAFRRCLALKPEGKLVGDAEDLLDHVENELLVDCRQSPMPYPAARVARTARRNSGRCTAHVHPRALRRAAPDVQALARAGGGAVSRRRDARCPLQRTPFPLYVEHAAGSRKRDVDGNEIIDYVMGHGALLLGHNHPDVVAAVAAQLAARHALRRVARAGDPLGRAGASSSCRPPSACGSRRPAPKRR